MPRKATPLKEGTQQALRNTSHELKVISWLMQDGWQVFRPILDNGHATDILISDGPNFFRLQIKTIDASTEDRYVENKWKGTDLDYVVYFTRNSNWGYIAPAFSSNRRKLNAEGHVKFLDRRKSFLKAFHSL